MRKLAAYSTFGDFANRPAIDLAERSRRVAPMDDARVFLASGGGDAIDTAAKLARRYWVLQRPAAAHAPDLAHAGYHGTHGFGTSLGGIEAKSPTGARSSRRVSTIQHDSLEALEAEILRVGPDRVAAFFCEPVIGAGGVLPPPTATSRAWPTFAPSTACCSDRQRHLRLRPARHLVRLRALGGVRPDLITSPRASPSGYLPLGGVIASARSPRRSSRARAARAPPRRHVRRPSDPAAPPP